MNNFVDSCPLEGLLNLEAIFKRTDIAPFSLGARKAPFNLQFSFLFPFSCRNIFNHGQLTSVYIFLIHIESGSCHFLQNAEPKKDGKFLVHGFGVLLLKLALKTIRPLIHNSKSPIFFLIHIESRFCHFLQNAEPKKYGQFLVNGF